MTRFRKLKRSDLDWIRKVYWEQHADDFGLSPLAESVTCGMVEKDGERLAFGMVALIGEAIMVLDKAKSKKDKVKAMRLLMEAAMHDSRQAGMGMLHMFVSDPSFAEVLKKHYGAEPAKGEALVVKL